MKKEIVKRTYLNPKIQKIEQVIIPGDSDFQFPSSEIRISLEDGAIITLIGRINYEERILPTP